MQDSAKLLGFDSRREMSFSHNRELQFPIGRPVDFDVQRQLSFDFRRALPFGVRGVIFRGYVCPVCGAQVAADAKECDECGVAFLAQEGPSAVTDPYADEQPKRAAPQTRGGTIARPAQPESGPQFQPPPASTANADGKKAATPPASYRAQTLSREPPKPAPQPAPRTFACPVCNAPVPLGSRACPKCTVQFEFEAPQHPPTDSIAICPSCGLKVSSHSDYCTQCGEPLSPAARAKHDREMSRTGGAGAVKPGIQRVGEPQRSEAKTDTITWDDYMRKQKGGS